MSAIPLMKLIDARVAYEGAKGIPCVNGCAEVNFQSFPAQSLNTSKHIFNVNVPSLDTGLVRNAMYHWQGYADFVGTPATGQTNLLDGIALGLSDSCADQVISTETINIGNKANSVERSRCGVELNRINAPSKLKAQYQSGAGGVMPDFATNFHPWINSNRNVLAQQYDVVESDQIASPRTDCIYIGSNTPTTARVYVDIYFPSVVSPLTQSGVDCPAIRKIDVLIANLQLQNMISLFSYDASPAGLSLTLSNFTFTTSEIWISFVTPAPHSVGFFPAEDVYDYDEVTVWTNTQQSVTHQSQSQFNLQQISSNVIPDKILIGVRPVQALLDNGGAELPRFWLPINDAGVNLKFNNTTILNSASNKQLYEMSLRNGLSQVTFPQFQGRNVTFDQSGSQTDLSSLILGGCFMVIDPQLDCQISTKGLCNGAFSNWTITGSITVENQTHTDFQCELFVVAITSGTFVSNGKVTADTGLLTRQQFVATTSNAEVPVSTRSYYQSLSREEGYQGGSWASFWRGVKSVAGKVAHGVEKALPIVQKVLPYVAKFAGVGYDDAEDDEATGEGEGYMDTSKRALVDKKAMARSYMSRK